jgi:chromosome segregation ATPase
MRLSYTPNALLCYEQVKNTTHTFTPNKVASIISINKTRSNNMLTIKSINDKIVAINKVKAELEEVIEQAQNNAQDLIESIPKAQIPSHVYEDIMGALNEARYSCESARDYIDEAESAISDAQYNISDIVDSIDSAMSHLESYEKEVNKQDEAEQDKMEQD